jgi:hypothetical protein
MTSCIIDQQGVDPVPPLPGAMAEVAFLAEMPSPTTVATRVVGSVAENRVNDIYVLVFETGSDGKLLYKGKGKNLTATGGTNDNRITFNATLPVESTYDLMVLANAESILSGIAVSDGNKRKSDVRALVTSLTAGVKWPVAPTMTPIPMWGEVKDYPLDASSAVAFSLTRMLARVNVEYSPSNAAVNNFRLSSVRVYNYSTAGAPVPADGNFGSAGATAPTAPAGGYGARTGEALIYTDITDESACTDRIYLFEAPHNGKTYREPAGNDDWIDNPCLVIGGRFSPDGGTTWPLVDTYYRVDFIKKDNGDEWLSLLRNHTYNVTITGVSGEGFAEPGEALKSAPFNIEANILPWNERGMEKVVFDGVFYMSVSRDEFVFQRRAVATKDMVDGTNVVKIKTDYLSGNDPADPASGWHVDRIVEAGTDTPVTWLALNPAARPAGWRPDDIDEAWFSFTENPGPVNREADVWIRAGRLEYKIHVVQRILSLDILDTDATGNPPIGEMLFVVDRDPGNRRPTKRKFDVTWTPTDQPVSIVGVSPMVWNPFEPIWVTGGPALPAPDQITAPGTIPPQPANPVGKVTYTVTAPEVTDDQINLDPFYEKETSYRFSVQNGSDREEKEINLRQIYYNIVVDTHSYRLDGGTATLTVRSNTEWEITAVEEWLYNDDPATVSPTPSSPVMLQLKPYDNLKIGTTGGPNVNGEAVAFTTVDNESAAHKGKWGTVWVTFHSPTGKFPDHRVALAFPPASKLLLGLGYTDPAFAPNPGVGSAYHTNSAYNMLSSPYNFGSMDESTHKVEGFRIIGYHVAGDSEATPSPTLHERNWHVNSLRDWLNNLNPDVIAVGSYHDGSAVRFNANEMRLLNEYLDNGGALILFDTGEAAVSHSEYLARLMESFFGPVGSNTSTAGGRHVGQFTDGLNGSTITDVKRFTTPGSGGVMQFNDTNDPILNGPFGDIRGMKWGTHYGRAGVKTDLIADEIITLSDGLEYSGGSVSGSDVYTTIFRHKSKNLLWVGCDGFLTGYYRAQITPTYNNLCPFYTDETNYFAPIKRQWYGAGSASTPTFDVYNSVFFANAVAWALTVTNHTPPAGGYVNLP